MKHRTKYKINEARNTKDEKWEYEGIKSNQNSKRRNTQGKKNQNLDKS